MSSSSSRPKSGSKTLRPAEPIPERTVSEIDSWYETAGLVRSRGTKAGGIRTRAASQEPDPSSQDPSSQDPSSQDPSSQHLHRTPSTPTKAANGVEFIRVPAWHKLPWLWHGFATRRGGVSTAYAREGNQGELNLGFTAEDDRNKVLRNREMLAEAVSGSATTPLLLLRQIHSAVVHAAGEGSVCSTEFNSTVGPCRGDGIMTAEPGILLGVQTADCTPVLVADRKTRAVAAFHAGWRGTVRRIVENGIGRMRLQFGSRPEDLVAAIGPTIGACCYRVGEEVIGEFESQFAYARHLFRQVNDTDAVRQKYPMLFLTQRPPGHSPIGPGTHLDLVEANRRQLVDAGLKPSAIQIVGGCTNCQPDLFFSHRGSQGRCGRMLSVIGVKP